MKYTPPGRMKSFEIFRDAWRAIDPTLGCDEELTGQTGPLGQPKAVFGRTAGNRFCVHPMEGWDGAGDGLPTSNTLRRWRRFGESGAKLIWGGEAFAVRRDGRANPNQLFLNPDVDVEAGLRSLLAAIHEGHQSIGETCDDLVIGLQLTHSGRFARPHGDRPEPRIAHRHPMLDARVGVTSDDAMLADEDLRDIADCFADSANLAQQVGFHFVDVKCCHGYLLHELLGAHTRSGDYGGPFENRTRLLREIIAQIRSACPGLGIGVRVSIHDLVPHETDPKTHIGRPNIAPHSSPYRWGFGVNKNNPGEPDFTEPFLFLDLLRSLGVDTVNVTLGSPYYCPHAQRPAAYPPSDGYDPPEDPLAGVARHIHAVRTCRSEYPDMTFVGSGYSYLQEFLPHVAQYEVGHGHADFVGLGRMMLSYPNLPRDVLAGRDLEHRRICRTFSDCTTAPRHGMFSGCYPLDDYYGSSPQAAELRVIKQEIRSVRNQRKVNA